MESSSLWIQCLRALEHELPEQQFNTWVRPLQAMQSDDALRLLAPNRFVVDWVNANLAARLGEILKQATHGEEIPFSIEVGARPLPAVAPSANQSIAATVASRAPRKPENTLLLGARLNPDSTFDGFVEGKSNHFAKAAALQVAENPGRAYNPLFIYGGVGLGKTHLMHAIGHMIKARDPDAKIAYVHSERFVSDMVKALQHNTMDQFKTAYRTLSALLIDDIQFFAGKDRSQEEFFHTFNALLETQQQV
ncbi:MAG: DnaA/Hda family protein, partial [Steroidobacteraceae bacterium]